MNSPGSAKKALRAKLLPAANLFSPPSPKANKVAINPVAFGSVVSGIFNDPRAKL